MSALAAIRCAADDVDRDSSLGVRLDGCRIAIASDTWAPQLNGVTRTLERLVAEIERRGGEARVFTTTDPRATPDARVARSASIPFWAYPQLRLAAPSSSQMGRELCAWGATLVHAATPFGVGLAARRAAREAGIPFVTSYHTSFNAYARFYGLGAFSAPGWRFLRWFHNSGARTYCPTLAVARDLRARGFVRTAVWARGVDCARFVPTCRSLALRRSLGIGDGEIVVAYVGRVAREKGIDTLLDGVRRYRRVGAAPPVRLLVVGDGPYLQRSRRLAPFGSIFTGRRVGDELAALYASSDLFVFPSTTDTFGNVVLEAMASGIPVLAADCDVTREIAMHDGARYFAPHDPSDLARKLEGLARDPAQRRALSVCGRSHAESMSWERVFDALLSDYRRVGIPAIEPNQSNIRPTVATRRHTREGANVSIV